VQPLDLEGLEILEKDLQVELIIQLLHIHQAEVVALLQLVQMDLVLNRGMVETV
jgi:hypothetical protein